MQPTVDQYNAKDDEHKKDHFKHGVMLYRSL